ncbi:unnamed protein product [Linum trigynum]|uniref:Uncharacterized protein n=1 Tax=Linum trigynum TaxID=586398 RepID=A0AAV2C8N0_9ROSI
MDHQGGKKRKQIQEKEDRPGNLVDFELNAISSQHKHLVHEWNGQSVREKLRIQSHVVLSLLLQKMPRKCQQRCQQRYGKELRNSNFPVTLRTLIKFLVTAKNHRPQEAFLPSRETRKRRGELTSYDQAVQGKAGFIQLPDLVKEGMGRWNTTRRNFGSILAVTSED